MPLPAHGVDGLVCDGFLTAGALGEGDVHVALLAVGLLFVLVVAALRRELFVAVVAAEVVDMPSLLHRPDTALRSR